MEIKLLQNTPREIRRYDRVTPSSPTFQHFRRSSSFKERSSSKNHNGHSDVKYHEVINDDAFIPPDAELAARIVEQVEFYFSDVNIMKDTFLLQHMKHNKDGYISLKLLSGFKRIKQLVKNWRELAHVLEHGSKVLQLNEERTKLRRVAPLPSYDETAPSRTVVAFDLPLEKPVTIRNVVNLFEPCGKIVLARILLPKNPIPADVRTYLTSITILQGAEACAMIEFADTDSVQCAVLRRPASPQAAPLVWGNMRVIALTQLKSSNLQVYNSGQRGSFQGTYPLIPQSPLPSPRKQVSGSGRRHSCPTIQFTPTARRRVSITATLPDNVVRMPRGPDGTRGFHDRAATTSDDTD